MLHRRKSQHTKGRSEDLRYTCSASRSEDLRDTCSASRSEDLRDTVLKLL